MSVFDCSVMFQFKSSKKSNNGTDVNAGQIPQLLYRWVHPLFWSSSSIFFFFKQVFLTWYCHFYCRLPCNDGNTAKGKQQISEPVHILKRSFARTVSVVSCMNKPMNRPVLLRDFMPHLRDLFSPYWLEDNTLSCLLCSYFQNEKRNNTSFKFNLVPFRGFH